MKKYLVPIFLALTVFSANANAWFFFVLPGSVTSKISDAITGSEGENCVSDRATVGDRISVNGKFMVVKSLSGTSSRCTNVDYPIRALLEPSSDPVPQSNTQAKIDLPDGWESRPPSDVAKNNGTIMRAYNRTIDSWLQISVVKRSAVTDIDKYVGTLVVNQTNRMKEAVATEIARLAINGLSAWKVEVTGKFNNLQMTMQKTLLEGQDEILVIEAWTTEANFPRVKDSFATIISTISGLSPPTLLNNTEIPKAQTSPPVTNPNVATRSDSAQISQINPAQRLRDLNQLLKDSLITEADFETKKKEILNSM